MRILLVTNSITGGGAERSTNLIANELTRRGHEVLVAAVNEGPPDAVELAGPTAVLGRTWRGGPVDTWRAQRRLRALVASHHPDVVHAHCALPELLAVGLPRHALVVTEHHPDPWSGRHVLGRAVRWGLARRAATWVVVQPSLRVWGLEGTSATHVPNPILRPSKARVGVPTELRRLGFVGRLSPEKGPDRALLAAQRCGLPVTFVGDGRLRSALESQSRALGVDARFAGQVRDPWSEVSDVDLLLMPSRSEGDGLVAAEAALAGIPTLLADLPQLRRFGFPALAYVDSDDALEDRIRVLVEDPHLLRGLMEPRVSDEILAERDVTAVVERLEAVYEEAVPG